MKTNLLKIIWRKEQNYWKRFKPLYHQMHGIGGKVFAFSLVVLLVSTAHYAFALMHTLFECVMFFWNRKQFKENITNIWAKLEKNPELV